MLPISKKCAKCDKQVYPVEELKCLDKIWHKSCFKCTVCAMTLNIKNYQGFEKQPYCAAHCPKATFTNVTDNPEILRIKENTKNQSNAKYHEDFEKSKGTYTVIGANDPETKRILENSKIISQAKYHGEYEKNKDKYTPIADNIEITRAIENQKLVSGSEYKSSTRRDSDNPASQSRLGLDKPLSNSIVVTYKAGERDVVQPQQQRKIGSIADYDPLSNESPNGKRTVGAAAGGNNFRAEVQNTVTRTSSSNNETSNDTKTTIFKAIYDYDASEMDEISFRDGDRFLECQVIDVGWMVGVHEKSGKYGFFPSNYVEPIETL